MSVTDFENLPAISHKRNAETPEERKSRENEFDEKRREAWERFQESEPTRRAARRALLIGTNHCHICKKPFATGERVYHMPKAFGDEPREVLCQKCFDSEWDQDPEWYREGQCEQCTRPVFYTEHGLALKTLLAACTIDAFSAQSIAKTLSIVVVSGQGGSVYRHQIHCALPAISHSHPREPMQNTARPSANKKRIASDLECVLDVSITLTDVRLCQIV